MTDNADIADAIGRSDGRTQALISSWQDAQREIVRRNEAGAIEQRDETQRRIDRRGKVDFTKSKIMKLRTQKLVTQSTAFRDLGTVAAEPSASKRGVTAARVAALTAAITAYAGVINTPRGEIVNRGALLKEVETDIAALLEEVDDLAVQFDGDEAGKRFIEAWKRARIIVDSGGGHGDGTTPPAKPA